jgi:hypothetical protein
MAEVLLHDCYVTPAKVNFNLYVRFQVLTAVVVKSSVFSDIIQYSTVKIADVSEERVIIFRAEL